MRILTEVERIEHERLQLLRDLDRASVAHASALSRLNTMYAKMALVCDRLERAKERATAKGAPTPTTTPAAESKGDH